MDKNDNISRKPTSASNTAITLRETPSSNFTRRERDPRKISPDVGYPGVKGAKRDKLQDARRRESEEEKSSFISIPRRHAARRESEHIRKTGRQIQRGEGEEEETYEWVVSTNAPQTGWPEWFPVFGVAHTRRGGNTVAVLRGSRAPGRSGERESSRTHPLAGGLATWRVHIRRSSVFAPSGEQLRILEFLAETPSFSRGSVASLTWCLEGGRVPPRRGETLTKRITAQ